MREAVSPLSLTGRAAFQAAVHEQCRACVAFGAPAVVRRAPSNAIEPRWGSFFNAEEQRRRERPHFRFSIEFEN